MENFSYDNFFPLILFDFFECIIGATLSMLNHKFFDQGYMYIELIFLQQKCQGTLFFAIFNLFQHIFIIEKLCLKSFSKLKFY